MLGSLQVHYALLGGDDVDEDGHLCKGISNDEWRAIRSHNLFSRGEIARLKEYRGFVPFLPVSWALAEVKGGFLGTDAVDAMVRALTTIYGFVTTPSSTSLAQHLPSHTLHPNPPPLHLHHPTQEKPVPDGPTRVAINQFRTIACSFRSHSSLTFDLLNAPYIANRGSEPRGKPSTLAAML